MRPAHDIDVENELPEDIAAAADESRWISRWDGPWHTRPSLRILLLLIVFCVPKLLMETAIDASQRAAGFHSITHISSDLRSRLTQDTLISILAGLRGVVADYYWRDVTESFMREDWSRMRSSIQLTTMLQPNSPIFWGMGGWHMAYNVAIAKRNDKREPSLARRIAIERYWVEEGEKLMRNGLEINPESVDLHIQLAQLHLQRLKDPVTAAKLYEQASLLPGAQPFNSRLPGFILRRAGREQEALDYWRRLWARHRTHTDKDMDWPRILREIRALESKLNVPIAERIRE